MKAINLELSSEDLKSLSISIVGFPLDYSKLALSKSYDTIVVHHTSNTRHYSMPMLYKAHVQEEGWGAIGYHFTITKEGFTFYTRPLTYQGAHAFPNTGKIGIAFSCSLNSQEMNRKALASYSRLVNLLQEKFDIPDENIIGHIQVQIRNVNKMLMGAGVPEVSEEEFLQASSFNDFLGLKLSERLRLSTYPIEEKVLREFDKLKTCPGTNFYRYLRGERR